MDDNKKRDFLLFSRMERCEISDRTSSLFVPGHGDLICRVSRTEINAKNTDTIGGRKHRLAMNLDAFLDIFSLLVRGRIIFRISELFLRSVS